MNSFFVDLNDLSIKKPRIRRFLVLGAILCFVLMIASIALFLTFQSSLGWFVVMFATYFVFYVYYAWMSHKANLYVKADSTGFDYKFGLLKRSNNYIMWATISRIKIGPAYIRFIKKSGRRKLVQLNWLPYVKVIEIKDSLIKMCESKHIPFEKADIIDYSKKKEINIK
jgi:Ca2+/Na+ antiporter